MNEYLKSRELPKRADLDTIFKNKPDLDRFSNLNFNYLGTSKKGKDSDSEDEDKNRLMAELDVTVDEDEETTEKIEIYEKDDFEEVLDDFCDKHGN